METFKFARFRLSRNIIYNIKDKAIVYEIASSRSQINVYISIKK